MKRLILPKKPREVQIHVAITLVGDRLSVRPEEREDVEVGQWAARFESQKFGALRRVELEKAFLEFYDIVLRAMRELGVLKNGE